MEPSSKAATKANSEGIGSDKLCPLSRGHHCLDACEWNDGEGCIVWPILDILKVLKGD